MGFLWCGFFPVCGKESCGEALREFGGRGGGKGCDEKEWKGKKKGDQSSSQPEERSGLLLKRPRREPEGKDGTAGQSGNRSCGT